MGLSLLQIVQIISIIGSAFGIIIGILKLIKFGNFAGFVVGFYTLFLCVCLFSVEIYIISCFRYFGFMLKNWGKGCCYLLLGLLIFNTKEPLCLVAGIIFWVLAVLYFVLTFVAKGIAKPLAQKGEIKLETSNDDYYIQQA